MATDVIMPALGVAQDTGRVVRWLYGEGDAVTKHQPLIEIETDKVTVELEAPADGTLAAVTASPGDDVAVGTVIALILAPGEALSAHGRAAPGSRAGVSRCEADGARPGHRPRRARASPGAPRPGERRASGCRRRRVDAARPVSASRAAVPDSPASPVSHAWRTMAERTLASWTTTPHFSVQREVNAGRLLSWQRSARERTGARVTVTDLLVRSVAHALRAHPALNRSWSDGELITRPSIGVGLAVALDDGLVVPVIHDADTLDLADARRAPPGPRGARTGGPPRTR